MGKTSYGSDGSGHASSVTDTENLGGGFTQSRTYDYTSGIFDNRGDCKDITNHSPDGSSRSYQPERGLFGWTTGRRK